MINWQGTVLSQYNQSPSIQSLLYAINQWIDPTADLNNFYKFIWNVDTAQGYGLDVWGRIVAVGRVLRVQTGDPYWGFDEATILSAWPFNTSGIDPIGPQKGGIFYQNEPLTGNYALSDDAYRTLILAKALFNITNGSIPAMNQILINLFADQGRAFIVDNLDMSMTYHFEFTPSPVDAAIISQSGVMPKPTGVSVAYFFGASSALPVQTGTRIGGVGRVRVDTSIILAPSSIHGAGAVRVSAGVLAQARTRITALAGLRITASWYLAQQAQAATRIAAIGGVRGAASLAPIAWIGGAGGVHVNATLRQRLLASTTLSGAGGIRVTTTASRQGGARVIGAGGVRPAPTVH